MSKPIVYSKDNCVECLRTKIYFQTRGYDFEERKLDPEAPENAELMNTFREKGFGSFPIVQYGDTLDQAWSGHRDNLLNEHYPARP